MRHFCRDTILSPEECYLADTAVQEDQIIAEVDDANYLVINMPPRFGKTSLLRRLQQRLQSKYYVMYVDFGTDDAVFASEQQFVHFALQQAADSMRDGGCPEALIRMWLGSTPREKSALDRFPFSSLSRRIDQFCQAADQGVVLLVDNADANLESDCIGYLLGVLQQNFIDRQMEQAASFQSAILMSVHSISVHWDFAFYSIASYFDGDLSFSTDQIAGMLQAYEADHQTGMAIPSLSREIRHLTGGHPYLVSWLCNWLDTEGNWTPSGFHKAGQAFLDSNNPLLQGIDRLLGENPECKQALGLMLQRDLPLHYAPPLPPIELARDHGLLVPDPENHAVFRCPLLEAYCRRMIQRETPLPQNEDLPEWKQRYFWHGKLDLPYILLCFQDFLQMLYDLDKCPFTEEELPMFFWAHMAPILDGIGSCREVRDSAGDLRIVCLGYETLVRLRVWDGGAGRTGWLRDLEKSMDQAWIEEAYLALFHYGNPGPLPPGLAVQQ